MECSNCENEITPEDKYVCPYCGYDGTPKKKEKDKRQMKPIIFNTEMVRAVLDGRKAQTRRIIKPQPPTNCNEPFFDIDGVGAFYEGLDSDGDCDDSFPVDDTMCSPYKVGEEVWVKETFHVACEIKCPCDTDVCLGLSYKATPGDAVVSEIEWSSASQMRKWASRITLAITDVRVERVQDIDFADCISEGIIPPRRKGMFAEDETYEITTQMFENLWNSIHDKDAWDRNDWVWVISFKRVVE